MAASYLASAYLESISEKDRPTRFQVLFKMNYDALITAISDAHRQTQAGAAAADTALRKNLHSFRRAELS